MKKMRRKIPKTVWLLSLVSLLNDTASEMLYPVMPIFITQVLGAPVFVLGIIEGIAEGSAALFKTYFGNLSDKTQRRKPFVVGGYGAGALAKIIIALSYTWPVVFVGRFVDRLGKGMRTGARDALLLESTNSNNKGFIFGFHRTMDTFGAVLGPTLALILLYFSHNNLRLVLWLAIIPAFLSLLFFIWVKEARKKITVSKLSLSLAFKSFPRELKLFLVGMCIFSLGNSSDSFLILRSKDLGLSLVMVVSAYILYNIVYALSSTPAGIISDKIGPKWVFATGIIIFVLVYLGFAIDTNGVFVWPLFGIYGFYIALTDGVSKAFVGSLVSPEIAGTAYGVLTTVTSLFTVLASVVGGILWSLVNPSSTFLFAAICAVASLFVFLSVKKKTNA